ncbi:MAG: hypothetical protein IPI63_00670 [Methanothrix sp.]|uniref:hypothetical protein n=1 Tax=Methanothrix sp. TaxID=90426 RepID=UPI0025F0FFBE|nr:hypothetical protein [Methanothrix sp.]MBK7385299.1 hypothetical protein [Methanothrix sp.]
MSKISKNSEIFKLASRISANQDAIRSANEDLIKLSQRFGRMMPRLQKLESSTILHWLGLYNKIKDAAKGAEDELSDLLGNDLATANRVLQMQINYYQAQRQRLYAKMEVMDDVLNGMMEDLLENGEFEEGQKEEMRVALEDTMEKSRSHADVAPVLA